MNKYNRKPFFLKEAQYRWLCKSLPQPKSTRGRPALPNTVLLNGILYVLKTGCRWEDIPQSVCKGHYSSCWRRLRFWHKRGVLLVSWHNLLKYLDEQGTLNLEVGNLDGSVTQAPRFRDGVGYSGKHRRYGTKVSLLTDKHGVPLVEITVKGNRHDVAVAQRTINRLRVGRKKRRVRICNGDKGYDSKTFRCFLRHRGTRSNIPERNYARRRRRGRPPVYDQIVARFRPIVERTFAWLKYFRKLRYRWERTRRMFQAFVDLACLLVCLRKVKGILQ